MEQWYITAKHKDMMPKGNLDIFKRTKLQILYNRDIVNKSDISSYFLNPVELLHDAELFCDYSVFRDAVNSCIQNGLRICIVGDYDVDGIMSTSILVKGLKRLGADVIYKIPDRINDGYGINERIVKEAKTDGCALIITCDNGVQAFDAVDCANETGLNIFITDHHEVKQANGGDVLPKALGVINPHRSDSLYPFKYLCGAGIVYKLIIKLLAEHSVVDEELNDELIAFAAIATVCDVVSLTGENRIITHHGILKLRETKNIGLNKIIEISQLDKRIIDTYHLGFIIGPRFNSSGRLDSAVNGVELLLTQDEDVADKIASYLNSLNEDRKELTESGYKEVINKLKLESIDDFIVEYVPDTHESVVGIIAGRIKERFYRPAIILTNSNEEGLIKGSGRSIEDFNLFEAIDSCGELLEKYGGHMMACGLTLKIDKLVRLKNNLNQYARDNKIDLVRKVFVDMIFPIEMADLRLVDMINAFKPFGVDNPSPLFADTGLALCGYRVFGKNKNVIKLNFNTRSNVKREAVLFKQEDDFLASIDVSSSNELLKRIIDGNIKLDIVYHPKRNEFNGSVTTDLIIDNYRYSRR